MNEQMNHGINAEASLAYLIWQVFKCGSKTVNEVWVCGTLTINLRGRVMEASQTKWPDLR